MNHPANSSGDTRLEQAQGAYRGHQLEEAYDLCLAILSEDPGHLGALVLLAEIYQTLGHPEKALRALQAAHQSAPDDARTALYLAWQLALMNALSEALLLAGSINEAELESSDDWRRLGQLWTRLEQHESAARAYERALAAEPADAMLWHELGNSLRFLGRIGDAHAAYRRAVDLNPAQAISWYAVAELEQEPAETLADDVQRVLSDTTDITDRIYLKHACYRAFERAGRYQEAFRALESANRLQKERLQFDFAEESDRLQAALDLEFSSAPATHDAEGPIPIFVLGMPRTGTTLVDRIISSHSEVVSLGELQHLAIAAKRTARTTTPNLVDGATLTMAARQPESVGEIYLESVKALRGESRYFVDSMPINFYFLPFLLQALPQARVICMQRHPLDACFSNYRQLFALNLPFYRYSYDLSDLGQFYPLYRQLSIKAEHSLGPRFMNLAYENLVEDPEATIRRIIDFCGLPWDPSCLAFHKNRSGVSTASAVQVREPVNRKYMGRWKHYAEELKPLARTLESRDIPLDVWKP